MKKLLSRMNTFRENFCLLILTGLNSRAKQDMLRIQNHLLFFPLWRALQQVVCFIRKRE